MLNITAYVTWDVQFSIFSLSFITSNRIGMYSVRYKKKIWRAIRIIPAVNNLLAKSRDSRRKSKMRFLDFSHGFTWRVLFTKRVLCTRVIYVKKGTKHLLYFSVCLLFQNREINLWLFLGRALTPRVIAAPLWTLKNPFPGLTLIFL